MKESNILEKKKLLINIVSGIKDIDLYTKNYINGVLDGALSVKNIKNELEKGE